jgi:hypothetical protein
MTTAHLRAWPCQVLKRRWEGPLREGRPYPNSRTGECE